MKKKNAILILAALLLALTAAGCVRLPLAAVPVAAAEEIAAAEPASAEAPAEPESAKAPARELPPLPDLDINSWEFLYAGPHCGVGRYHPHVRNVDGQYMDERCTDATIEFLSAARAQGFEVYLCSAYRNWEYTIFWYEEAMRKYGGYDTVYNHCTPGSSYEAAKHGFAAGCSEHSTGLAFDITDESYYWADVNYSNIHDETVADTPVCQWMDEHCAEYGFIVRYPENKQEVYGMACYPGHYRYVGKEAAAYIMENDLCFEEFLALYGKTIAGVNYVYDYVVRDA